jgi:hypothetical protein
MGNAVTVYFTDGTNHEYASIADAEIGIMQAVVETDFAIGVESVDSKKWPNLTCNWSVELVNA